MPGIAIPFYLAHPRLMRLERSQMLAVEGGTPDWCLQILRHEAGHAFDNAYELRRRRRRVRLFGSPSTPYPDFYLPRPYSKSFVLHLDSWYAQSHPDEDFAETFAVWLTPDSDWRRRYAEWGALRKLEYMDELMREVARLRPVERTRRRVEPLERLRTTLRKHYARKRAHYGVDYPNFSRPRPASPLLGLDRAPQEPAGIARDAPAPPRGAAERGGMDRGRINTRSIASSKT